MDERQRIAEAVRRRVCGPCGLSSDEARVLGRIVTCLADGVAVPSRVELAAEMELPLRTLETCIPRLGRVHGLVFVQRCGRAAAVYHVDWFGLAEWAGIRSAAMAVEPQISRNEAEKRPVPHARGSSSSSSPPRAVADLEAEAVVRHDVEDAARVIRSFGISVPFGLKSSLEVWVRRGMTIDDFRETAELASKRARDGKFAYMEACLEDRWRGAVMGTSDDPAVVRFEDYRGYGPSVGA